MKYKYVTFNIGQNKSAINSIFLNSLNINSLDVLVIGLQEVKGSDISNINNTISTHIKSFNKDYDYISFDSSAIDLATSYRLVLIIIYKKTISIKDVSGPIVYRMTKDGIFSQNAKDIKKRVEATVASTKGILLCNLILDDKQYVFMTCHMPVSVNKKTSVINHYAIESYLNKIKEIVIEYSDTYMILIGGDFNSRFVNYELDPKDSKIKFANQHFNAHNVICSTQHGGNSTIKSKSKDNRTRNNRTRNNKTRNNRLKYNKSKYNTNRNTYRNTYRNTNKVKYKSKQYFNKNKLKRRTVLAGGFLGNRISRRLQYQEFKNEDEDGNQDNNKVEKSCIPSDPKVKMGLNEKLKTLKEHDLLSNYYDKFNYKTFMSEPEINFLPTYKLNTKESGLYISNKPLGYADRIFICPTKNIDLEKVLNVEYKPLYIYGGDNGSDHLPLALSFEV
jgi:hypothetical protein